jgi:hypothetical protein
MSSPSYYRREAARCRELAASSPNSEMRDRWRLLATDYENLADALDTANIVSVLHAPMQRQPMQQQQAKTEPDDKQ